VNYADDFVIVSRGYARQALAWTQWVMGNIGLRLNEEKTCIRDASREPFSFLGYTFGPERYRGDGHWYLAAKPSKKAIHRFKRRLRETVRRGDPSPWSEIRRRVNWLIRGWTGYFSYGTRLMAYRSIDNYVYQHMRNFLRHRHKVPSPGTRRFPDTYVFGDLGILRLRRIHLPNPARACT